MVQDKDFWKCLHIPTFFSQAFARSHVEVKGSYSGAPLHIPTLTAAGMNVLYVKFPGAE